MVNVFLAETAGLGQYIAIWKLGLFTAGFVLWAWVGTWVNRDARLVRTNRGFWNNVYFWTGVGAFFMWFLLPAPFLVALLLFLAVWLTTSITYVMHRNARVPRDEQVLTPEHIRCVLSRKGQERVKQQRLTFVSSLGNTLPMPARQEGEYEGWASAEDLLYDLMTRRVSVAELLPTTENYRLTYVIDGVAGTMGERERGEVEQAILYLKAVGGMEVKDRRRPQSGHFTVRMEGDPVEWRLQTAGSTRGEQLRLRRVEEAATLGLDALGFNGSQLEKLEELVGASAGVMLVCGPKQSGVTTTLYSIMRKHDAFTMNLHTLERDSLTDLDNITQHLVEPATSEKTTARQLQSVLRGDPDVVLVGFCDDGEMAKVGLQACREGKKLYYGMEEPSAFHALQSWMKMVNRPSLVAETLLGVTSQRLLRKLCLECRQAYVPDAKLLRRLNLPADKIKQFFRPGEVEYDKRGNALVCEHCQGTGYYGRTGVFETLLITEGLRKLIRENAPINAMREQCRKDKMLYLQEEALRKVIDGTTSIQEILRVTAEKKRKGAAKQST